MSKSNNTLVRMVNLWAEYAEDQPDLSMEDFCWKVLRLQLARERPTSVSFFSSNGRTVGMLGRLGKFATLYSKKALAGYNLSTVEEWIYLLRLYTLDTPKKSELIYGLISEFPSGSEIIKRLKGKGFVSEYIDPSDRRSKRLKISEKGKKLLRDSMPKMEIVSKMALNRLNEDEKIVLDYLLNKLDAFHTRNYKKVHKASFEEAYSTILEDLDKSSEGGTH